MAGRETGSAFTRFSGTSSANPCQGLSIWISFSWFRFGKPAEGFLNPEQLCILQCQNRLSRSGITILVSGSRSGFINPGSRLPNRFEILWIRFHQSWRYDQTFTLLTTGLIDTRPNYNCGSEVRNSFCGFEWIRTHESPWGFAVPVSLILQVADPDPRLSLRISIWDPEPSSRPTS